MIIMIDVPMPGRCRECFCVQENEGQRCDRMRCRAMVAAGRRYTLVLDREDRPMDCPIRMGTAGAREKMP